MVATRRKVVQCLKSVDPLAEPQANHSTYAYTYNNPIAFFDPTGMMGESVGADGLTNEQWLASSRPGADEGLADSFREENRLKNGNSQYPNFRVYIANDSKSGAFGKYTLRSIIQIITYASDILSKNGINNLTFIPIDPEEAKKHEYTKIRELFLAIISDEARGPGVSEFRSDGAVGVYDSEKNRWLSWVNYARWANGQHDNPQYALGYTMAHELLHQLLFKASNYLDYRKFRHDNSIQNLNMEGHKVKVPLKPLRGNQLHQAEVILEHQRNHLHRYFVWLKFWDNVNN